METIYAVNLQKSLGAYPDGVIGRNTLKALFRKLSYTKYTTDAQCEAMAIAANVHLKNYGILDSPVRLAHFLGQMLHETGSFRYSEEIASGRAYEGRADLGNTVPGYGVKYKGRGKFQLTGYYNYRSYGYKLGYDFVNDPDLAARDDVSLHVACQYWDDKGLNALADKEDLPGISRKINGGYNGYDDRVVQTNRVRALLGLKKLQYKR